jgi:hypothetical protein
VVEYTRKATLRITHGLKKHDVLIGFNEETSEANLISVSGVNNKNKEHEIFRKVLGKKRNEMWHGFFPENEYYEIESLKEIIK